MALEGLTIAKTEAVFLDWPDGPAAQAGFPTLCIRLRASAPQGHHQSPPAFPAHQTLTATEIPPQQPPPILPDRLARAPPLPRA